MQRGHADSDLLRCAARGRWGVVSSSLRCSCRIRRCSELEIGQSEPPLATGRAIGGMVVVGGRNLISVVPGSLAYQHPYLIRPCHGMSFVGRDCCRRQLRISSTSNLFNRFRRRRLRRSRDPAGTTLCSDAHKNCASQPLDGLGVRIPRTLQAGHTLPIRGVGWLSQYGYCAQATANPFRSVFSTLVPPFRLAMQ